MGGEVTLGTDGLTVRGAGAVHGLDADLSEVGELTPVLAALAAVADSPSRLRGVGHIRGHETDRIAALARELTALGAGVTELPTAWRSGPGRCAAASSRPTTTTGWRTPPRCIGLIVPGIELNDVACTSKTLPDFPALWSAMVSGRATAAA